MRKSEKYQKGFTLVELMIVVAILAVIAAFAVPSYQGYVARSHRVEARNALQEMANRLQQNYSVTRQWNKLGDGTVVATGDALPTTWGLAKTPATGTTRYLITVDDITPTTYLLRATAQGVQQKDRCAVFYLNQSGSKMASSDPAASAPPTNGSRDSVSVECWSK